MTYNQNIKTSEQNLLRAQNIDVSYQIKIVLKISILLTIPKELVQSKPDSSNNKNAPNIRLKTNFFTTIVAMNNFQESRFYIMFLYSPKYIDYFFRIPGVAVFGCVSFHLNL